jgi:hypothetical protein
MGLPASARKRSGPVCVKRSSNREAQISNRDTTGILVVSQFEIPPR